MATYSVTQAQIDELQDCVNTEAATTWKPTALNRVADLQANMAINDYQINQVVTEISGLSQAWKDYWAAWVDWVKGITSSLIGGRPSDRNH